MFVGDLCNGSTADSDSVCRGSNPLSPAKKHLLSKDKRCFLMMFAHQASDVSMPMMSAPPYDVASLML